MVETIGDDSSVSFCFTRFRSEDTICKKIIKTFWAKLINWWSTFDNSIISGQNVSELSLFQLTVCYFTTIKNKWICFMFGELMTKHHIITRREAYRVWMRGRCSTRNVHFPWMNVFDEWRVDECIWINDIKQLNIYLIISFEVLTTLFF